MLHTYSMCIFIHDTHRNGIKWTCNSYSLVTFGSNHGSIALGFWDTTTTLHSFCGLFSRSTRVSQHQEDKPLWTLLEQEMMGWQWHQLDHMQISCTSLQTDNHASTSTLSFYRPDALPAAQPTASRHWSFWDTDNVSFWPQGHFGHFWWPNGHNDRWDVLVFYSNHSSKTALFWASGMGLTDRRTATLVAAA